MTYFHSPTTAAARCNATLLAPIVPARRRSCAVVLLSSSTLADDVSMSIKSLPPPAANSVNPSRQRSRTLPFKFKRSLRMIDRVSERTNALVCGIVGESDALCGAASLQMPQSSATTTTRHTKHQRQQRSRVTIRRHALSAASEIVRHRCRPASSLSARVPVLLPLAQAIDRTRKYVLAVTMATLPNRL
jgi:hypothetical protein